MEINFKTFAMDSTFFALFSFLSCFCKWTNDKSLFVEFCLIKLMQPFYKLWCGEGVKSCLTDRKCHCWLSTFPCAGAALTTLALVLTLTVICVFQGHESMWAMSGRGPRPAAGQHVSHMDQRVWVCLFTTTYVRCFADLCIVCDFLINFFWHSPISFCAWVCCVTLRKVNSEMHSWLHWPPAVASVRLSASAQDGISSLLMANLLSSFCVKTFKPGDVAPTALPSFSVWGCQGGWSLSQLNQLGFGPDQLLHSHTFGVWEELNGSCEQQRESGLE